MSQHDFNIANQSFPNTRSDLNNALVALATNSSGAAAPSTTNAFMHWADSGNDIMKLRNEANSDWISLYKTDGVQQYASGSTAALPAFSNADDLDTGLYFPAANNIAIATGGTGRLYIDSNGNVGLNNPTPSTALDVVGAATITGDVVVDTTTFKVDSTNNRVGIGTTTPISLMHLATSGGSTILTMQRTNANTTGSIGDIIFNASDNHTLAGIRALGDGNNEGAHLLFGTTSAASGNGFSQITERMRLTSAGALLINYTSDPGLLSTGYGFALSASSQLSNAASNKTVAYFNRTDSSSSGGTLLSFRLNGNEEGSISITSTATSYNTSSDYRLKENVKPITEGLSRLMQLKPSRFNFISDKDKTVDGFIAHEAQEIVPECVTGTKDGMKEVGNLVDQDGKIIEEKVEKPEDLKKDQKWEKTGEEAVYQGIDQSKLVPLLVSAVQQLKKEIDKLKNKK